MSDCFMLSYQLVVLKSLMDIPSEQIIIQIRVGPIDDAIIPLRSSLPPPSAIRHN